MGGGSHKAISERLTGARLTKSDAVVVRRAAEESTAALQVAVARLLGYRWPEQGSKPDDLDVFADVDGIVCLPSVAGEQPARRSSQRVLTVAFGEAWSPAKSSELLEQAGGKRKN